MNPFYAIPFVAIICITTDGQAFGMFLLTLWCAAVHEMLGDWLSQQPH